MKKIDSSTSKGLRVLQEDNYVSSFEDEQEFCNIGQCSNHCCNTEDDLFNIYFQFTNLKINVLTNVSMLELLRVINDPELRSQIIDKLPTTSEVGIDVERIPSQKGPYTMFEIRRLIKNKSQPERPATVQDLCIEINYLKKEIMELKASKIALDERIFKLENSDTIINKDFSTNIIKANNGASTSEENTANTLLAAIDFSEEEFLKKLQYFTTQKFLIKITLSID